VRYLGKSGSRSLWKNIYLLGLTSFFTDMSTESVLSILPVFFTEVLGAPRWLLGFVDGLAESINYLTRVFSGAVADRLGSRKWIAFLGYTISNVAKPMLYFATSWYHVLVIRIVDRFGKGVRGPPRDALISLSVRERVTGRAFGIQRALDELGATLGPLAATLILLLGLGYRSVFLFSAIPGALALLSLLPVVDVGTGTGGREVSIFTMYRRLPRSYLRVLVPISIMSIGFTSFSFILLLARSSGIPEYLVPMVFLLIHFMNVLGSFLSGFLCDAIGSSKVLLMSFLMYSATCAVPVLLQINPLIAVVTAVLYGLYQGIYEVSSRALVPTYVPSELRGVGYSALQVASGVLSIVGFTIFGYLWDVVGVKIAFTYSLTIALVSSLVLYLLTVRRE